MMALHQPVAADLRRIVAVLKINTDLERMGDLAENIAEQAVSLAALPPLRVPEKLQRMTELTAAMVRQCLDAFFHLDVRMAHQVCRWTMRSIDSSGNHPGTCRDHACSPELVEPGLSLFSATRHLERIADHATNIAEDVIYLAEGEIVRHRSDVAGGTLGP